MALIAATPGSLAEDWSALQAMLERQGLASVVLAPPAGRWAEAFLAGADALMLRTRRQGRPLVVVTFADALDSMLTAIPASHPLRASSLVAVTPMPFRESGWRELWRKVRPGTGAGDDRLDAWSGSRLIVRAREDNAFDSTAAVRLRANGRGGELVLAGGRLDRAPKHPADYDWLAIIRFLTGTGAPQEVIVGGDSASVAVTTPDTSSTSRAVNQRP